MTSPMPETMSPREKVELTLKSWCEGGLLQDYASVTDAILTALASGSGDHAELARLVEWRDRLRADPGRAAHFGSPYADKPMQNGRTYWNSDLADDITALIAEVALLREENGGLAEAASRSEARLLRATEAERKLAEVVGLLRDSLAPGSFEGEAEISTRVRTFLNKEAERG